MPTEGVVTFESAEAKASAIENYDEGSGTPEELDRIMAADVVAGTVAPEPEAPESVATPEPVVTEPVHKAEPDDIMSAIRAKGFDTPGKFLKSFDEAQALIDRQQRFIKEKIDGNTQFADVMKRAEAAELKLAELSNRAASIDTATVSQSTQNKIVASESKLDSIKSEIAALEEVDGLGDFEESAKRRKKLYTEMVGEIARLNDLVQTGNTEFVERLKKVESTALSANDRYNDFLKAQEETKKEELSRNAYMEELATADSFVSEYPEFSFSDGKKFSDMENEYISWAESVARMYYGRPIKFRADTPGVIKALDELRYGNPALVEACKVAGVPTTQKADIKKYLDVCDLMDYRDGKRKDPLTGGVRTVETYNPVTGKFEQARFPSLKTAYEARLVEDGTYANRIKEAYRQGARDIAAVANQRSSTSAVELDNVGGVSSRDAGLGMSQDEARKIIEGIDETVAMQKAMSGDKTDLDLIKKAYTTLTTNQ
jgi:hypothetical protein